MKRFYFIAIWIIMVSAGADVSAQYYNVGQRPLGQSWRIIKTDSLNMIFPAEFESQARRMLYYMENSREHLNYGFDRGVMRTPVIFSTQNFSSNGMAMLAPKRIEIFSVPSTTGYSEPWLKQLAVHEYRHMVQYNNINRSTVKALSFLFGQQAPFAATALIPFWFIEGDAVMAETQASEFGRGLQPSFNMHYRALGRELLDEAGYWRIDKWFAGSIKRYVPSHYELGYQMVAYAMRRYDTYIGQDMYRYSSNFPFLLATTQIALKKYYDTSTAKMFRETFSELNDYWNSLPPRENSAVVVSTPRTSYTTYSHPQFISDSLIVVLKEDYDRFSRFVEVDIATADERKLMMTGVVNSRPAYGDGRIWWTEYRQSALWEQRINSQLCYADVGEWCRHDVKGVRTALFPVPLNRETVAYVEYDFSGRYYIVCGDWKFDMPRNMSVHGLAWDDISGKLFMIAMDDKGMGIVSVVPFNSNTDLTQETRFSHITISDLRAQNGAVYFGSVASGYDEIHTMREEDRTEYRLTESEYGAFDAAVSPDNKRIAMTVYDKGGYSLAVQDLNSKAERMFEHGIIDGTYFRAKNIVNPPVPKWSDDVPIMTEMEFTPKAEDVSNEKYNSRRYRRALRLFNLHSWMPVNLDPLDTDADSDIDPTYVGVTLMSQSLMGDMEAMARYGLIKDNKSMVAARMTYSGLPVRLSGNITWSNRNQFYVNPYAGTFANPSSLGNYLDAKAMAYAPMLLNSGYIVSWLTPVVEYKYNNMLVSNLNVKNHGYLKGEQRLTASLQYSMQVRKAALDINPRWGFVVRGSASTNVGPTRNLFYNSWSVYGRAYTPGVAPHHSLTIAAAYQDSFGGGTRFMYNYDILIPHGYGNIGGSKITTAAASYQLPLCYPDVGVRGLAFLKRIRLAASFEYGHYRYQYLTEANNVADRFRTIYTTGATLYFDIGFLRLPSQTTSTITLSVYFPKDKSPYVSGGFSIPF